MCVCVCVILFYDKICFTSNKNKEILWKKPTFSPYLLNKLSNTRSFVEIIQNVYKKGYLKVNKFIKNNKLKLEESEIFIR